MPARCRNPSRESATRAGRRTAVRRTRTRTRTCPTAAGWRLIHNGIIENFAELKQELLRKGVIFQSETDTEVAAALLGDIYRNQVGR